MKLLLDECVHVDLRQAIPGHEVFTVAFMGWKGIANGKLLALAASEKFDALITTDRDMPAQQNAATLPCAIVVLHAKTHDLPDLLALVPNLLAALTQLQPRTILQVQP